MAVNLLKKNSLALVASLLLAGHVHLIGVDAIRGAAMRVIGNKFGGSKE